LFVSRALTRSGADTATVWIVVGSSDSVILAGGHLSGRTWRSWLKSSPQLLSDLRSKWARPAEQSLLIIRSGVLSKVIYNKRIQ
jgi:hypothetical protein